MCVYLIIFIDRPQNASFVVPLPITSSREEVVDFTAPFHISSIDILQNGTQSVLDRGGGGGGGGGGDHRWLFNFIEPLSPLVWLLLFVALILVSANVYAVEKLANWTGPVSVSTAVTSVSSVADHSADQLTIRDSAWFVVSAILMRDMESTSSFPRTFAGRIAAVGLRFFSLMIVLSYTANLAVVLMTSRRGDVSGAAGVTKNIRSARDLIERRTSATGGGIRLSTGRRTDVSALLEVSNDQLMHQIWQRISEQDSFVDRPDDELRSLQNTDSAFVWHSPAVRYMSGQNCDLRSFEVMKEALHYAIAVPQGATYRDRLSMAVLNLIERGALQILNNKYGIHMRLM